MAKKGAAFHAGIEILTAMGLQATAVQDFNAHAVTRPLFGDNRLPSANGSAVGLSFGWPKAVPSEGSMPCQATAIPNCIGSRISGWAKYPWKPSTTRNTSTCFLMEPTFMKRGV